jgi:hypothetical protein
MDLADLAADHIRMATPSEHGRNVKITVNLWYDPGTKRVHLTSNDPDLPREGIATNFKPGSQAERNSLILLAKYGKLPEGVGPAPDPST